MDLSNAFPSFNIEESLPVNKSTVIDLSQEVKDNKLKVSQIESETENICKMNITIDIIVLLYF